MAKSKYPQYAYKKWNIVLLSWQVHDQVERNIDLTPKVKALTQELLNKYKMEQEQKQEVTEPRELTFGQDLVGLTFNPSGKPDVDQVKRSMADIADLVANTKTDGKSSYTENLLYGDALRSILHAQMSVVKYLTYKK